jgi:hypothetical protein
MTNTPLSEPKNHDNRLLRRQMSACVLPLTVSTQKRLSALSSLTETLNILCTKVKKTNEARSPKQLNLTKFA